MTDPIAVIRDVLDYFRMLREALGGDVGQANEALAALDQLEAKLKANEMQLTELKNANYQRLSKEGHQWMYEAVEGKTQKECAEEVIDGHIKERQYKVYKDGNMWCAVGPNFINLHESLAAFDCSPSAALASLVTKEQEAEINRQETKVRHWKCNCCGKEFQWCGIGTASCCNCKAGSQYVYERSTDD